MEGTSDPAIAGADFTITMDYDEDAVVGDGITFLADFFSNVRLSIGTESNTTDFVSAQLLNTSSAADDQLSFDFIVENDPLAGNYSIDFTFLSSLITAGQTLGDIIGEDGMMGTISQFLCAHFLFNVGDAKYDGTLVEGGIEIVDNVDVIPLPGAAVFMLSGLAAAGATAARRRRAA